MPVCFLHVLQLFLYCHLPVSVTSDGFGSLVLVEATTTCLEVLAISEMFQTTTFCLCIFCFACCIRAKQPLFATWISLSHNLHTALNLSLSCDLHHHSSKCPFESFFFSQVILNFVFGWDILKYLVIPQFNLKIITLLIERKKKVCLSATTWILHNLHKGDSFLNSTLQMNWY